jgi:uncharacterized protein YjbI with pentapeptide repeats
MGYARLWPLIPLSIPHPPEQEVVLTKAYAVGADLSGADLTNAVVDRVDFTNANLAGAKLINTVVTGATFEGERVGATGPNGSGLGPVVADVLL